MSPEDMAQLTAMVNVLSQIKTKLAEIYERPTATAAAGFLFAALRNAGIASECIQDALESTKK